MKLSKYQIDHNQRMKHSQKKLLNLNQFSNTSTPSKGLIHTRNSSLSGLELGEITENVFGQSFNLE